MISTGMPQQIPIPRNSHCFCCSPSLCASLFLLFMCTRLQLVLLHFSWAEMCLPSAAGPVLRLPGQKAGRCAGCVEHTGRAGSSTQPGTRHLPRAERLRRASHLCLHGATAQGTYSPSVHACSECTGTYLPPACG